MSSIVLMFPIGYHSVFEDTAHAPYHVTYA